MIPPPMCPQCTKSAGFEFVWPVGFVCCACNTVLSAEQLQAEQINARCHHGTEIFKCDVRCHYCFWTCATHEHRSPHGERCPGFVEPLWRI